MSLLEIDRLSVRIGETEILREVSLSVAPGEIVALTGESGSGKSMTALAAMGLLPRGAETSGALGLGGEDLLSLSERRLCGLRGKAMGMIFQEPMTALNPVQTIGAQVAETARIHAATPGKAEDLARRALDRAGLEAIPMDRYPHELSGGQRQRVVIAIATVLAPRLLIADEPTTALDVTTQARILSLLERLAREDGMGLLLITHDLAVVHGLADRIAVMNKGEVVETGPTKTVFAERRHPYTRALFEASAHRADLVPQDAQMPLLTVKGLTRTYPLPRPRPFAPRPRMTALKDVSFTLGRGERLGLVGESGSGKSTLTRALLGLDPVDSGTIALAADAPGAKRMQVVFQDPYGSFNPRHRVRRLLAEPFHGLPDAPTGAALDARIARALNDVGLEPSAADRHIHAFSGGQRQRIAIARALITDPEIILFDEATSALDVRVRAQILDLIADLSRRYGLSYIFISHDLSVVRGITDRVLVLKDGEIVEDAATETLFDNPRHPYTIALMEAAPRLPDHPDSAEGGGDHAA
ncbi:dipeptide ABC transporter ATP-binding protein [Litorisediminicola beolgyonensis]|uniref:Dipeptide ABC transporter ATP-binding protein n=1 Tax=Litorisediminicola beolgyonensis TaxID=1173614 RepID=A0ABW3ZNA4_9RHOB